MWRRGHTSPQGQLEVVRRDAIRIVRRGLEHDREVAERNVKHVLRISWQRRLDAGLDVRRCGPPLQIQGV